MHYTACRQKHPMQDAAGGPPRGAMQQEATANGNAIDWFIDRHIRDGGGDRPAFSDPWRSQTYAGLAAATHRFAGALRAADIGRARASGRRCATPTATRRTRPDAADQCGAAAAVAAVERGNRGSDGFRAGDGH